MLELSRDMRNFQFFSQSLRQYAEDVPNDEDCQERSHESVAMMISQLCRMLSEHRRVLHLIGQYPQDCKLDYDIA